MLPNVIYSKYSYHKRLKLIQIVHYYTHPGEEGIFHLGVHWVSVVAGETMADDFRLAQRVERRVTDVVDVVSEELVGLRERSASE